MSRHLYDIYKLASSPFAEKLFTNPKLYEEIVLHRQSFTRLGGVDYKLHNPQTINPIPPAHLMADWEKDYSTMQEQMIYADSPEFKEMLESIQNFISKINQLDWLIIK